MTQVPDSGTFIVIDGQVFDGKERKFHLEHVGLGAFAYVSHNGIDHVMWSVQMPMECDMCQAHTSKARADSGDLSAVAHCPKHQLEPATV